MNREHHTWYSPSLDRDMDLLVHGWAGAKVLVFPTRKARFHEYEDMRIVDRLQPWLDSGDMQLFCVDSVDEEALYSDSAEPAARIARHMAYERYILDEVLPFMDHRNDHPVTVSHGCSMGAFHAANIAFRHPHRFDKLVAFSGRYDPTLEVEDFRDLLDGYRDQDVAAHTPTAYLPELGEWQLQSLRRMEIVMVIGREDPFLANNHVLSAILDGLQVPHTLVEWDERAHRGFYWRRMAPTYLAPLVSQEQRAA